MLLIDLWRRITRTNYSRALEAELTTQGIGTPGLKPT